MAVFAPAIQNGFVAWDDDKNFLNNPHYRGLGPTQLSWMWSTFRLGHYVPLSWMTLGADYLLWGMRPAGYHATNLCLHAANAVLVYLLAKDILGRVQGTNADTARRTFASVCSALFFSLHPLRVESVAWITERRDMLSLFFYLSSILTYLRVAEPSTHARRQYWLSLLLFACALLSKATAMTLPAVLLLINFFPLKRLSPGKRWNAGIWRSIAIQLIPFVALSVGAIALSVIALHPPPQLGLAAKTAVSAYSLSFYLFKTLVPIGLSPLYQMPLHVDPAAPIFLACYVLAAVLIITLWHTRSRWPGVTTAVVAFVIITAPMLGVVQNGPQIAADRYTYHSSVALALLFGGVVAVASLKRSIWVRTISGVILSTFAVLTWRQTYVWRDSQTLWAQALEVDPQSSIAHSAYASVLFEQGRVEEAAAFAERAVAIAPNDPEAQDAYGVALARQGLFDDAIARYRRALDLKPTLDEAHNNWGLAMVAKSDFSAAIGHFQEALALNPDNADVQVNWGNTLVRMEDGAGAIGHYQSALLIRPDHADAEHNWGVALARQGALVEAIGHFGRALEIRPDHAEAKEYLARAMTMSGKR